MFRTNILDSSRDPKLGVGHRSTVNLRSVVDLSNGSAKDLRTIFMGRVKIDRPPKLALSFQEKLDPKTPISSISVLELTLTVLFQYFSRMNWFQILASQGPIPVWAFKSVENFNELTYGAM